MFREKEYREYHDSFVEQYNVLNRFLTGELDMCYYDYIQVTDYLEYKKYNFANRKNKQNKREK